MGIAAYNRGSRAITEQANRFRRAAEFIMMDELNSLPKADGAPRPFGPVRLIMGHGGWWAECPTTGFGFWFKTLRCAVRAFRIEVREYHNGAWLVYPA